MIFIKYVCNHAKSQPSYVATKQLIVSIHSKYEQQHQKNFFSDPIKRVVYSFDHLKEPISLEKFAGNGEEKNIDGPTSSCSFKQPCGIAIEFNEVVYITDAKSASIHVVTNLKKNVEFLQSIGSLHDAFSVHAKGEKMDHLPLHEASKRIKSCLDFLLSNQLSIREDISQPLPLSLDGRHGNVASKTINSVDLVYWAVNRLDEIRLKYDYNYINLMSCTSLDVEHFHATTHYYNPVLSMQVCHSH